MSNTTVAFNVFVDGKGYAGSVTEFTPPVPTAKLEESHTGGMLGPVDIPMGLEKMEASMVVEDVSPDALKLFGIAEGGSVPFELRNAARDTEGRDIRAVHKCRGNITKIDFGTTSAGAKSSTTISMSVRYYEHQLDGIEMMAIDMENMVFRVNGVDRLAGQRSALGL